MSEGLNRVTLLGNLGADAELRVTQSGTSVANLRLAVSESYKDKDGVKQEKTEWVSCTLWGRRAEALHKYLVKGTRLLIEGSLRTSSYDKDGVKVYKTEVNVSNVVFAGGNNAVQGGRKSTQREQPAQSEREPEPEPNSDDVPF